VYVEFRTEMLLKIANCHRYLLRSAFRQHADDVKHRITTKSELQYFYFRLSTYCLLSTQDPQQTVVATNICFLTNFTELEIPKIQANYWWGQMHCGPPKQNFEWAMAMAHPAHAAMPPCCTVLTLALPFLRF